MNGRLTRYVIINRISQRSWKLGVAKGSKLRYLRRSSLRDK